MSFGKEVKKARIDKGWRQNELQAKTGLTSLYLGRIERDEADPRLSIVLRIARALEVSLDTLTATTDRDEGGV